MFSHAECRRMASAAETGSTVSQLSTAATHSTVECVCNR